MACHHPLPAWSLPPGSAASGKRVVKIGRNPPDLFRNKNWEYMEVPCGKCMECRLEKSRQWAMRMVHEASLHEDNCYITLTYADKHLPLDNSINRRPFQLFMKRLRKLEEKEAAEENREPRKIKYYMCGEYGEQFNRPHYHACLFNYDFPDKVPFKEKNGHMYYVSAKLHKLWTTKIDDPYDPDYGKWDSIGNHFIGNLTFESAAYVARYVTKKINGEKATEHYLAMQEDTGEIHELTPEFSMMSRRPGIGKEWYDKWKKDAYPSDFLVLNGRKMKPPKYYDQLLDRENPELLEEIKERRRKVAEENAEEHTPERLAVKEKVLHSRIKRLKRGYENET